MSITISRKWSQYENFILFGLILLFTSIKTSPGVDKVISLLVTSRRVTSVCYLRNLDSPFTDC